ncbi:MAG TPA: phosphatidylglycerophosphatase A [Rhodocyclaceae bacterium]|nr:MAG: phosphatidylglycerophosphatase A [Betaproteobacteria bacterium CG2_30_68_42]PIV71709.1 MAG: phosphatidylglycerophosphatase A [Rhodocyclales bacterium CG17_big_fil_post_rev_8_21_14_2_50_68_7]PIX76176.1 MAG: phosphatidylglycerophosphatase A [Rhodocyclales bacterium CG_4_10_14_3_um_filter_68_10]PJA58836.1 MAG: phosphatidylglycerophosphatase A [Rhodocyclales bacterium CG_4_9_14_3_um_filter_68_10]HCX32320.1 phosphatidylglycerophosphatase A [Rhodocyclaceae bacterium]
MNRPGLKFLFASPAHFIACGLGSGLSPFAPGTAGTLAAWLLFPLLRARFSDAGLLIFLAAAFVIGIFVAQRTGEALGVADHGAIVWDEMVPFWLVLLMTPEGILWQAGAFFLFRAFDVVKPPPARWIDTRVKNGFGVMADDAVAALYTLLVLAAVQRLTG